jgi:hypothetical protein
MARKKRVPFLITIDTEGDNIWSNPGKITTENSQFLPRFQALCEKYGLKPTYLTNYEMATCDRFVEFGRDAIGRGQAEIGMHLHAWNSPPVERRADRQGMPYLIEFPVPVMVEKVRFITNLLERQFGVAMISHRAGRWAFNAAYAQVLLDHGYLVDCSVTPHVSWRETKGFIDGEGGPDYRGFPTEAYFVDTSDISRRGNSALLEVPMTIDRVRSASGDFVRAASNVFPRSVRNKVTRFFPSVRWFRPNGRNLASMLKLLGQQSNAGYIEFMLHSSELMPGGSPTFPSEWAVDLLYDHLEQLFAKSQADFRGATLSEFRAEFDGAAVVDMRGPTATTLAGVPLRPKPSSASSSNMLGGPLVS